MNTLVLSQYFTGMTGHKLAKALNAEYCTKVPVDYKYYDRIIRWGASYSHMIDDGLDNVLNRAVPIARMANRLSMFKHFNTHDIETLELWPYDKINVIRKPHSKWGEDIRLGSEKPIENGEFAVEQWLADYEIRLHIVLGTCVRMQIKRLHFHVDSTPMRHWYIRNRKHGWHLYPLSNDEAHRIGVNKGVLRTVAKHVIKITELDFGVVDFLVRCGKVPGGDGVKTDFSFDYKVLEVNTAPSLEETGINLYVERLNA